MPMVEDVTLDLTPSHAMNNKNMLTIYGENNDAWPKSQ